MELRVYMTPGVRTATIVSSSDMTEPAPDPDPLKVTFEITVEPGTSFLKRRGFEWGIRSDFYDGRGIFHTWWGNNHRRFKSSGWAKTREGALTLARAQCAAINATRRREWEAARAHAAAIVTEVWDG